jgi:hypothetical protein
MTALGLKFVPGWTRDVPRAAVSAAATQAVKANTANRQHGEQDRVHTAKIQRLRASDP